MTESRSTGHARSSAGVPDTAADARIAELEERLAHLEGSSDLKQRGRHMLDKVMPKEATTHFFNAGREQLLGMRAIVDFWLARLDQAESEMTGGAADAGRQTIEID